MFNPMQNKETVNAGKRVVETVERIPELLQELLIIQIKMLEVVRDQKVVIDEIKRYIETKTTPE